MTSLIVNPHNAVVNKTKWKMMLSLEKLILIHKGNIFGGYVRDKILHDTHAEEFYEYMRKAGINTGTMEFQLKYNDTSVFSELNNRCIVPSDIDCFMKTSQMKKMVTDFRKKDYDVKINSNSPANFYFFKNSQDESITNLKHAKMTITLKCNSLLSNIFNMSDFNVEIDVIHIDDDNVDMYDILSSNIDFECNSLIITSDNEYKLTKNLGSVLNPVEKIKKINNIISDIKKKKAVIVQNNANDTIPLYRWEKMILKGWKTISPYFEIISGEEYSGHCIICHDNIDSEKYHIKDSGCDVRFHMGCYLKMHRNEHFKGECPMCKCYSFINKTEDSLIQVFALKQREIDINDTIIHSPILLSNIMRDNIVYNNAIHPIQTRTQNFPRGLNRTLIEEFNNVVDDDIPDLVDDNTVYLD